MVSEVKKSAGRKGAKKRNAHRQEKQGDITESVQKEKPRNNAIP